MGIGVWQVVLVLVIVLIIFGAGKLPKVMGDVGKGLKNFKSGIKEGEEEAKDKPSIEKDEGTETVKSESTSDKKDA